MKSFRILLLSIITAIAILVFVNADKIKNNMSWMFETEQSASDLPELSNKEIEEVVSKNGQEDL